MFACGLYFIDLLDLATRRPSRRLATRILATRRLADSQTRRLADSQTRRLADSHTRTLATRRLADSQLADS